MLLDYQMTSGYPVGIPKQSHEMLTQDFRPFRRVIAQHFPFIFFSGCVVVVGGGGGGGDF